MNELDEHLELVHGARLRSLSPSVPSGSEVERMAAKAHRIADSGTRSTTGTWQVAVALVVAVVALGLATTLIPGNRAPIAGHEGTPDSSVRPEGTDATLGVLGTSSRGTMRSRNPALTDPTWPGVSLADAIDKANETLVVPDEAIVGSVKKAVVISRGLEYDPSVSRRDNGIGVAYANGVSFYFEPLPPEHLPDWGRLQDELQSDPTLMPFTDGRTKPFEVQYIDGVQIEVMASGTVRSKKTGAVSPVEAQVAWNAAEGMYILRSQSQPVGQLVGIAKSLIARGAR